MGGVALGIQSDSHSIFLVWLAIITHKWVEVEQQVGRQERYRWGPREVHLDIIFYDDLLQVLC